MQTESNWDKQVSMPSLTVTMTDFISFNDWTEALMTWCMKGSDVRTGCQLPWHDHLLHWIFLSEKSSFLEKGGGRKTLKACFKYKTLQILWHKSMKPSWEDSVWRISLSPGGLHLAVNPHQGPESCCKSSARSRHSSHPVLSLIHPS